MAETHPTLRVAVISKVYPMRSHTVSAEGGAAAAIKAEDSLDAHAYDTISGGDWLSDQDAVEAFVRERAGDALMVDGLRVRLFPCETHNYTIEPRAYAPGDLDAAHRPRDRTRPASTGSARSTPREARMTPGAGAGTGRGGLGHGPDDARLLALVLGGDDRPSAASHLTDSQGRPGTPEYMSPEYAAGDQNIDHRTDLYSLGAVGYTMLAGRPPHQGNGYLSVIAKRYRTTTAAIMRPSRGIARPSSGSRPRRHSICFVGAWEAYDYEAKCPLDRHRRGLGHAARRKHFVHERDLV